MRWLPFIMLIGLGHGRAKNLLTVDINGDTGDDASYMNERGLSAAKQGELEESLPLFKRATELAPAEDTYWSNYGVTLMRLNYLDEALLAYTRGLRLNPTSELIKTNMDALHQHIAHRSNEDGDSSNNDSASQLQSSTSRVGVDSGAPKSLTRTKPGSQSRPPPAPPIRSRHDRSRPSESATAMEGSRGANKELESWLGPWWKKRDTLGTMFRDALTNFRPVQIRNFLKRDKALALHDELYHTPAFKVYENYNRWYQFHFKAIYMHSPEFHKHALMSKLSRLFDAPVMKNWVRDISDSEVNGTTLAGASYYGAGDYTMPHTDKAGGGKGDVEKRRIAYILHLTKTWNPKFGGDMVWMNPSYHIHPSFNSMTFFAVSKSSWHFVSPVAEITPDHIKRLAFSGWWTSTNIRQADQIEEKGNDDLRHATFATVVNGDNARLIPHLRAYEALEGLWPEIVDA